VKPEETLSAQEMDALMSAVRTGTVAVTPGASRPSSDVVRYNFRRPNRVSKEQVRALGVLHGEFAKVAAASLSGMLRTIVDLELESVEQTAYGEYVGAMGTPTCSFVFNMEPHKGGAVLELNPAVAFVMIDRLLGGQGVNVPEAREFTEIERAVIERIGLRVMIDLQHAWQPVRDFAFRLLNLETNPQSIQVTSPNEVILVATLRLRLGEQTGAITLGYPYLVLEPLLASLGAQRWTPAAAAPKPAARSFMLRELAASPLTVRAFLGQGQLTVRELLNLQAGQLIPIEADPKHPVRVDVNGVPKFVGRPGAHHAHIAVELGGPSEERSPNR
jgi:flagellar motor switch protein FliM